jgi:aflatoxin B1 aldehyde reductase
MYNAITRDVEPELLKACRACNIRFYAYNPLAGGLLTGRYTSETENPSSGRFAASTGMGEMYRGRYFNKSYFEGLALIKSSCDKFKGEGDGTKGLSMAEAPLRWLSWHSALRGGLNDGVIIGASKRSHLNDNLDALTKGPLPQSIVDAFDQAWAMCRMDCPKYFRELNAPPGK